MENMDRRDLLSLAAKGAAAAMLPVAGCDSELIGDRSPSRPNIIFIMARKSPGGKNEQHAMVFC